MNREVGEQADQVQGSATATISILTMTPQTKASVIEKLASRDPKYADINKSTAAFALQFTAKNTLDTRAEGDISLTGSAAPTINLAQIEQQIKLRTSKDAISAIRHLIPRAFDVKTGN